MNQITYGAFETVSIPSIGIENVIAKIDTGAFSGALHCSKIGIIKRKSDGKHILRFTPADKHEYQTEIEDFESIYVRSSNGHRAKRYLFTTDIIIRDKKYPITIGLSDRSDMSTGILIGSRFLRENNILVNVRINNEFEKRTGDDI